MAQEIDAVTISQLPRGTLSDASLIPFDDGSGKMLAGEYGSVFTANTAATTTVEAMSGFTGPLKSNYFLTTDIDGYWYYDSNDTTSSDNYGTIRVTADGKRLKRYVDGPVRSEWFGIKPDFNPTAKTGTDNTDAIQMMHDFVRSSSIVAKQIIYESGNIGARYVNYYQFSIYGSGKGTVFYPIQSNETAFFRLAEDGPIQRCEWRNFSIYGYSADMPNQRGFEAIAKPQLSGGRTGGIWSSQFHNIEIKGFAKEQWYFECLDTATAPNPGDMAHQFLSFYDCKGIRPSDNISRCFKAQGQFGQILFENCNFDGNNIGAAVKGSVNVELIGRPDSSSSDSCYDVVFKLLTSQNADNAVVLDNTRVDIFFYNPTFENNVACFLLKNSSYATVLGGRYANAANGALIGEPGTGGIALLSNSGISFPTDIFSGGIMDRGIVNLGSYTGVEINTFQKQIPITSPIYQTVLSGNTVACLSHKFVLLNANASALRMISSNFSYGQQIDIKFQPSGGLTSQVIETGGNIEIPGLANVVFRTGQTARFKFNGSNWLLVNIWDAFKSSGSGDPEGVITANIGTEYIRSDGTSSTSLYKKFTGNNTNTGWVNIANTTQLLTKVNKGTSVQQLAIAADGSLNTGANSAVFVNASTIDLSSIISTLAVGDKLTIIGHGSGATSTDIFTDNIRIAQTATLRLGNYGVNGFLVVRQQEAIVLERINSPVNGWIVVSAPKNKYVQVIPQTGYWYNDDIVYRRGTVANENVGWVVTTAGHAVGATWAANTAISVGQRRNVGDRSYTATVAGTTSNTPPSHTTGTAIDGTVTWQYLGVTAVFSPFGILGETKASALTAPVPPVNGSTTDQLAARLADLEAKLRASNQLT